MGNAQGLVGGRLATFPLTNRNGGCARHPSLHCEGFCAKLMKAIASFVMHNRLRAVTATAGFGIGGLLIPLLSVVSNASVALVALRVGIAQAFWVSSIAAIVLGFMSFALGFSPVIGVLIGLLQWIPTVLFAQVLRQTSSWASVLLAMSGLGMLSILLLHLFVTDLPGVWLDILRQTLGDFFLRTGIPPEEVEQRLRLAADLMSGILAMAMVLNISVSLLIARYWQAALYNPGGFAKEYRALQLGRSAALVLLALLVGSVFVQGNIFTELALVLLGIFFLQGIAIVHAVVDRLGMHSAWLVGMYVLMPFAFPQMLVVLATMGALDAFIDFRMRLPPKDSSGGEAD